MPRAKQVSKGRRVATKRKAVKRAAPKNGKPKSVQEDIFQERPTDFKPPVATPAPPTTDEKRKAETPAPAPAPDPTPDVGWKELLPEMSGRWSHNADGYTTGAPVKHSLCPTCQFFLPHERHGDGLCAGAVNEATRTNPMFTRCYHAKPK